MSTTTIHARESEATIRGSTPGRDLRMAKLSARSWPATSWTANSATGTRPACTNSRWPIAMKISHPTEKEELFAFANAGTYAIHL